jgi:hypothetical protein
VLPQGLSAVRLEHDLESARIMLFCGCTLVCSWSGGQWAARADRLRRPFVRDVSFASATRRQGCAHNSGNAAGTADAVRQYMWLFETAVEDGVEDFIILSGDHLYRCNYQDFVREHRETGAILALLLQMHLRPQPAHALPDIDLVVRRFVACRPSAYGGQCSRSH